MSQEMLEIPFSGIPINLWALLNWLKIKAGQNPFHDIEFWDGDVNILPVKVVKTVKKFLVTGSNKR